METVKAEFNLLREPWIVVISHEGTTEEVGLLKLIADAHQYRGLAGELPTQDIAVIRLLLAILHSVFGRYEPVNGEYIPIYGEDSQVSTDETLQRWYQIWNQGKFHNSIITEYLTHLEDRFWLFHSERPFYQVPGLDKATDYTAAKLNGELAESGNKIRLFSSRGGSAKQRLTYAEAARWLLYVNGYDDTSAKPKGKNLPSPGAGWLGKLGLVMAMGHNLFETLMLNLTLQKDGKERWKNGMAVWEMDEVNHEERCQIVMPDNPMALLTLQSRRLLLRREGSDVIGYSLLGGDFFPPENAFSEQMTLWRKSKEKKEAAIDEYKPRRHDPARQLWRDLEALLVTQDEMGRCPGVVKWVQELKQRGLIEHTRIHFRTAAVKYGDKDFFVDDVFSDEVTIHADLLNESNIDESWIIRILDEVEVTDQLVRYVGYLAQNLLKAVGDTDANRLRQAATAAREQAYFRLDRPFRRWLEEMDPTQHELRDLIVQWREQARKIVRSLGRNMVEQCGPQAFAGRTVMENKQEIHYSAPRAYDQFLYQTAHIGTSKGGKKK